MVENDESPDAYDQLVDRLLDGQHFGERWARHWLDLARFAESNGYAFDKDREAAFHYRDFVIKAFNEDMPYDDFIQLYAETNGAGGGVADVPWDGHSDIGANHRIAGQSVDQPIGALLADLQRITL